MPLVFGGAEILVRELLAQLKNRGFVADLVSLPFKWYPKEEILAHAAAWRLIDLSESNGQKIDLVIATKFPSYFVRHPKKVTWLVHQHRAAYDLCGTQYGDFDHVELDVGLRQRLIDLDRQMLAESQRVFTIGRVTSARLEKFNGISAPPLYHPPGWRRACGRALTATTCSRSAASSRSSVSTSPFAHWPPSRDRCAWSSSARVHNARTWSA
ncbi:MAG: hypothetical protein EHM13_11500 [Acidobacteria bacterium]|nr:MAG: hypothetical protein EHM13_11500 [Acidobacteriota bacterium]